MNIRKLIADMADLFARTQRLNNYDSHKIFVVPARQGIGSGRCGVCNLKKAQWFDEPCIPKTHDKMCP